MDWLLQAGRRIGGRSRWRRRLLVRAYWRAAPVLGYIAALYRRIVLRRIRFIVVVGSFGKTTTSRVVAGGLFGPGVFRVLGNQKSGIAQGILQASRRDRFQVLEVGIADFGQMEPFARLIGPDVTVVTGIGTEHSRTLGGGADIAREKCKMVSVLPSNGLAVLNGDDPHVLWMAERTRARVITYGFDPSNDVSACNVKLDWPRGTTFTVSVEGTEYQARTRLIGRHMVPPVLAAVAVASAEGLAVAEVLANVAEVEPTRGRMHPVKLPNGAIMLRDDFKTPLESVYAALETLEEIPAERKIVVQADISEPPGKRRKVHREVGARIAEVADLAVFIGEGRKAYASGAARAGMPRESIFNAGYGVERALEYLRETLQPGDVVLVKGRLALRLERITLALQGLTVTCGIQNCPALSRPCELCPQLARDWGAPAGAGVERQTGSR